MIKNIQVRGHPRVGKHYIAAMIDLNLFDGSDYMRHIGTYGFHIHTTGNSKIARDKNILNIYVWRSFELVAESLFKMRYRFGLSVNDYNEFLSTTYKEMWTRDVPKFGIIRSYDEKMKHDATSFLSDINQIPKNYWLKHKQSWERLAEQNDNVFLLYYDDFIENPIKSLNDIADLIGVTKLKTVKNIKEQIGWKVI